VIRSFRHKGLHALFTKGKGAEISAALTPRMIRRLDALHAARDLVELGVPGFNFHRLKGKPKRYSIHVNGPFCLSFEWYDGDAWRVDWEQYH
jgi:proteic killer suppression protein